MAAGGGEGSSGALGVGGVPLRVECGLERHVRGDAGEQEHLPFLIDREGVDLLELRLRWKVAEECAIVVTDEVLLLAIPGGVRGEGGG